MLVRELLDVDRSWAAALVAGHLGSTAVVSRGVLHETRELPGHAGVPIENEIERDALIDRQRDAGD